MNPITLALDYSDIEQARNVLTKTKEHIGMIKIGLELWTNYGPQSLELGKEFDLPIFLDLKLHDIPNTVEKTVEVITKKFSSYNIKYLSVHALGCKAMLTTAVRAARDTGTEIAAVTFLTSLDYEDLRWLGYRDTRINIQTVDLAIRAQKAGVKAFICSAQNCKLMRKHLDDGGARVTLITPGIRLNDIKDDQKRTTGVEEAIKTGSDHLVVGRPITLSDDPESTAKLFADLASRFVR